jgi:hypothetical protein
MFRALFIQVTLIPLVLASCQSSQDRQWAELQTILETQK